MRKIRFACLAAILFSLLIVYGAFAQTSQLTLRMSRDWGYGGLNGDMEGLFSMQASGPSDLRRVDFFIDNSQIGEVLQAPFNLQFNTDNYPLGIHRLYAIGYSIGGLEYRSNVISGNFVPQQSSLKIILPILGIVIVVMLLSAFVPILVNRGKHAIVPPGAERKYGAGGGGICPKCHRPFALPLFSPHLGFSKLAFCPFCGKWSLVKLESIENLREAEMAELKSAKPDHKPESSEEEKLRKEIDDSKYQGS
jgi:hypothetical protein